MDDFASNLRRLMTDAKLNQVELARLSGVRQQYISRYLNEDPQGREPRDLEALVALCKALNCSLHDLTGLEALRDEKILGGRDLDLSTESIRVAQAYDSLSDDDPAKNEIKRLLGNK